MRLGLTKWLLCVFLATAASALPTPSHAQSGEAPPVTVDLQRYRSAPRECGANGFFAMKWGTPSLSGSYAFQMQIHQLVYLIPATPYVAWWLPQFGDGGGSAAQKYDEDTLAKNLGDELLAVSLKIRTNQIGYFQFKHVPCGRYVVVYQTWTSLPATVWDNDMITRPNRVWNRNIIHAIYESTPVQLVAGTDAYLDITKAKALFSETWRGPESV